MSRTISGNALRTHGGPRWVVQVMVDAVCVPIPGKLKLELPGVTGSLILNTYIMTVGYRAS